MGKAFHHPGRPAAATCTTSSPASSRDGDRRSVSSSGNRFPNNWSNGFSGNLTVANSSVATWWSWTLTFRLTAGQQLSQGWPESSARAVPRSRTAPPARCGDPVPA
ncbi:MULTISPECIES: cellulose binding domain-containing protein [unclassified Micromonospora]|uniref:cellulose binding domain-containing protein n=1 Tax=unclassified Micromonospora TaxID=2617518 RepID=UPI00362ABAF3